MCIKNTNQIIYSKNINGFGKVPWDYHFVALERFTEARNRSIRDNILAFINDIMSSDLAEPRDFD